MNIRKAEIQDTADIVELLKLSLGQTLLPKSEEIWNYKHLENPFGESTVLIGEKNGELIGVRALMKWEWQIGSQNFFALRAVDTATHPNYQGQGVFKKLTLAAIDIAKAEGYDLIFNTPNSQSLPGYLKMGWVKVDKLKVQLALTNPLFWRELNNVKYSNTIINLVDENLSSLLEVYNEKLENTKLLYTLKSVNYLNWRYNNNPLQTYEIIQDKDFFIACYVKAHSKFNELRCSEFIFRDKSGMKKAIKALRQIAKRFGVQVISSHVLGEKISLLQIKGLYGPILTLKDLNLGENQKNQFGDLNNWGYNLGDLELF